VVTPSISPFAISSVEKPSAMPLSLNNAMHASGCCQRRCLSTSSIAQDIVMFRTASSVTWRKPSAPCDMM
jgi:hypothetical protein